jgi:nitrous oxide reductase
VLNPNNYVAGTTVNDRWFTQATFVATFNAPVTIDAPTLTQGSLSTTCTTSGNPNTTIADCNPYLRFQEVGNGGSLKLVGTPGSDDIVNVPVPASLALMGLGLVGLAAVGRRR